MTTQLADRRERRSATTRRATPSRRAPGGGVAWALAGFSLFAFVVFVGYNLQRPGAAHGSGRQPRRDRSAPRPSSPCSATPQLADQDAARHHRRSLLIVVIAVVVFWRRVPEHPVLLMALACTAIVWQDPIMNWAPYAVYNPQLWHWPETWPLVLAVADGRAVHRDRLRRRSTCCRSSRRSGSCAGSKARDRSSRSCGAIRSISLALLIFAIGFVFDAFLEIFSSAPAVHLLAGHPVRLVSAGEAVPVPAHLGVVARSPRDDPGGVLLYRDDTGRTAGREAGAAVRGLFRPPTLGTFRVMFAIINVAYSSTAAASPSSGGRKAATSVACPYPYPEAKVYDPNGFYAKNGQPGPYFARGAGPVGCRRSPMADPMSRPTPTAAAARRTSAPDPGPTRDPERYGLN